MSVIGSSQVAAGDNVEVLTGGESASSSKLHCSSFTATYFGNIYCAWFLNQDLEEFLHVRNRNVDKVSMVSAGLTIEVLELHVIDEACFVCIVTPVVWLVEGEVAFFCV